MPRAALSPPAMVLRMDRFERLVRVAEEEPEAEREGFGRVAGEAECLARGPVIQVERGFHPVEDIPRIEIFVWRGCRGIERVRE